APARRTLRTGGLLTGGGGAAGGHGGVGHQRAQTRPRTTAPRRASGDVLAGCSHPTLRRAVRGRGPGGCAASGQRRVRGSAVVAGARTATRLRGPHRTHRRGPRSQTLTKPVVSAGCAVVSAGCAVVSAGCAVVSAGCAVVSAGCAVVSALQGADTTTRSTHARA